MFRLILVALAALPGALAGMSLGDCTAATNGKTEWHGLMQYKCVYSTAGGGTSTKIALINCRTPNTKTVIAPGKDARDGDFHYECDGDDKSLALNVEYCYLPGAGSDDLQVGESFKADGGIYKCEEVSHNGQKSITRTFAEVTLGCEIEGKKLKVGQSMNSKDGVSVLQCYASGGEAKMRAVGCLLADGKAKVSMWSIKNGHMCQLKAGEGLKCHLVKREDKCTDDGVDHAVNARWAKPDGEYRCVYANLREFKKDSSIELKTKFYFYRCIKEVNGKKTYISPNRASKAADGKHYWCRKQKVDGKTKYIVEVITDVSICTCEGGLLVNQRTTIDGVVYGCSFNNGKVYKYQSYCKSDNGKSVYKNKKVDLGGYGWVCVKVDGKYISRKMTVAEYKQWKTKKGSSVTGSGGFGEGVEGYEKDAPVCKEGFRLNDAKTTCLDVDECKEKSDDCSEEERCHNTEGDFKCLCLPGKVRMSETDTCEVLTCPCKGDVLETVKPVEETEDIEEPSGSSESEVSEESSSSGAKVNAKALAKEQRTKSKKESKSAKQEANRLRKAAKKAQKEKRAANKKGAKKDNNIRRTSAKVKTMKGKMARKG